MVARFTLDDVRALGAKLDGLDLSPGEGAVLDALLGADAAPEVEGFAAPGAARGSDARYRDQMAASFSLGFKVEIEGFTAPGDVAGYTRSGGEAGS